MSHSIDPAINFLSLSDDQKATLTAAVRLVAQQPAVFALEAIRLQGDYPKSASRTVADRLRAAIEGAAKLPVCDAPDPIAHARRLVLLAVLCSFPNLNNELEYLGDFINWPWRSSGSPIAGLLKRKPGEPKEPAYGPGRKTMLFDPLAGESADSIQPWMETLLPLVRGALAVIPTDRLPLSSDARLLYEILLALPEHEALTGAGLIDAALNGPARRNIDQSTFTKRLRLELMAYGMKNKKRIGYYIPLSARPSAEP